MQTLSLAVVGHTNTGKTSLMRTLLRDSRFGEVKNAAATTRHVAQAALGDGVETWLYLHDTPGLEDAGGVLAATLDNMERTGIERLQQFLDSPAAQNEWAQEAKVLRQVLASDAALYVVDAREDVLPKYKDELTVLSWCAKPVMPVFNFIHGQNMDEWQTLLARRSLHVSSRFDTVAFDFSGEMVLWQQLATLLGQPPALSALTAFRQQEWQQLERQAYVLVAQFLLDAAACVRQFEDKSRSQAVLDEMQAAVAAHESSLHQQLFALYRFYYSDADIQGQQVLRAFRQNPFDAELLKDYGIRTGKAAATGALLGLGVDALTLGTSLGLGATIGGVLGGLAGNWQVLYDKIQGIETLMIDNATLTLLAARSLHLLQTLKSRGHAATNSVVLQDKVALPWKADALPKVLQQARLQPKWSALNPSYEPQSRKRQEAVEALAARLAGQE